MPGAQRRGRRGAPYGGRGAGPGREDYRRRQRRGASAQGRERGISVLAPLAPAPGWIGSETGISAASDHRGGTETVGRRKRRQADGQPPAAAPVPAFPGGRGDAPKGERPAPAPCAGLRCLPGLRSSPRSRREAASPSGGCSRLPLSRPVLSPLPRASRRLSTPCRRGTTAMVGGGDSSEKTGDGRGRRVPSANTWST